MWLKKINCEFLNLKWIGGEIHYTCNVSDKNIKNDLSRYSGKHSNGKKNVDVTAILFFSCKLLEIPQKIAEIFPNLQAICIENCDLKSLCKSDLAEFKKFRTIYFYNNNLEYLPGDLFENFPNLKEISFSSNHLTFIEPSILDGLTKLSYVNFRNNPNYDILYSVDPNHLPNQATIFDMKTEISKKFYSRFQFVQELKISKENLIKQVQILTDQLNNLNLAKDRSSKMEIGNLKMTNKKLKEELEFQKAENSRNLNAEKQKLNKEVQKMTERLGNQRYQNSKYTNQLKQEIKNIQKSNQKLKVELENKNSETIRKYQHEVQETLKIVNNYKTENQRLKDSNSKLNQEIQKLNLKVLQPKVTQNFQKSEASSSKSTLQPQNQLFTDIKTFMQDETFKDFQIIIDDREFQVHKFILAARSPTLSEILRNNPEAENLKLVDISVEVFEQILKFLYTDELPRDDEINSLHLFAAAGRLKIEKLKNFAVLRLYESVNPENAIEILNISNKYGNDVLRQKAFIQIKKNYPNIQFNDEWIVDGDKIIKFIEAFKAREELMKKADEQFENLL